MPWDGWGYGLGPGLGLGIWVLFGLDYDIGPWALGYDVVSWAYELGRYECGLSLYGFSSLFGSL